jgi:hypothetical protein
MKSVCRLSLVVLLVVGASVARAQPNVAFELFQQGMQAMERNRFDEAVELLRASLESSARPPTAFNLALALRATGRLADASQYLERLLEGRYGDVPDSGVDEARELLATIVADMAELRIDIDGPDDAQLRVDGALVAPAEDGVVMRLDPGRHVVVLSASEHRTVERDVRLARGERARFTLRLERVEDRRDGVLVVECEDPEILLEVAGRRGRSPLRVELPPGEYTVEASASEGRSRTRVTVPAGREVRLTMDVPRAERPVRRSPWLWIAVSLVVVGGVTAATVGARRRPGEVDTAPFSQIEVPL